MKGGGGGGLMEDCDTELCLSPAGGGGGRRLVQNKANRVERLNGATAGNAIRPEQQITIFHGSRMCVCDVTEIQARAIICMAKREMDDMMAAAKKKMRKMNEPERQNEQNHDEDSSQQRPRPASAPAADPQLLNPGLSMKNSLQRFLQKRKDRAGLGPSPSPCPQQHSCPS